MLTIKEFVARVVSGEEWNCPLCTGIPSMTFVDACNHLLKIHKLKCLHIGQETEGTDRGLFHSTAATFGR